MEVTDMRKIDPVAALGALMREVGGHGLELKLSAGHADGDEQHLFSISAQRGGRRVAIVGRVDAHLAADMLAHRLLDGTECRACGKIRTTRDLPSQVYAEWGRSKRARCVWWRDGQTWRRGCEE